MGFVFMHFSPNGSCGTISLVLKTKEPICRVLQGGPEWHFTALGSSARLDTTIDAENEFEWYKKRGGVVSCPLKTERTAKESEKCESREGNFRMC